MKLIDRYLGIPLIMLLSVFKPKGRKVPKSIKRIAIIKGAAIGDTVLLSGIIQDIRLALHNVEIIFFAGKTCFDVANLIPGINQVVFVPTTRPLTAIKILRSAGHFDIVIDTGPWTRLEALLCFATKGAYRVGFHSLGQYRHFCYDEYAPHLNVQHELLNNRNLIKPFINDPDHLPSLNIQLPESDSLFQRTQIQPNAKYWILHAWSGGFKGSYKEWLDERWVDVASYLIKLGYIVVFTGAKANALQTSEILSLCERRNLNVINLAGKTSLLETIFLIQKASGVVSVNTGILHIAAAVETPVIGINGPVPSLRWGAISSKAINIDGKGDCCGYIHLGFEYPKYPPDCMGSILVDDVVKAINDLTMI